MYDEYFDGEIIKRSGIMRALGVENDALLDLAWRDAKFFS